MNLPRRPLLAVALALVALPLALAATAGEMVRVTWRFEAVPLTDPGVAHRVELESRVRVRPADWRDERVLYETPPAVVELRNGLAGLDFELPRDLLVGEPVRLAFVENEHELPAFRLEPAPAAERARVAARLEGGSHCDCERVDLADGAAACAEGRALAGFHSECTEEAPCIVALHCCRVCR